MVYVFTVKLYVLSNIVSFYTICGIECKRKYNNIEHM